MYWSNDDLKNAFDHDKIEIEYLHFGFDIHKIAQR